MTAQQVAILQNANADIAQANAKLAQVILLTFELASHDSKGVIGSGLLVKSYFSSPQMMIFSQQSLGGYQTVLLWVWLIQLWTFLSARARYSFPLSNLKLLRCPFSVIEGVINSSIEGDILSTFLGVSVTSVPVIFEHAEMQSIGFAAITPETSSVLATLDISSEAKSRIFKALSKGLAVIVPKSMVLVKGLPTIGWWEIDTVSGAHYRCW